VPARFEGEKQESRALPLVYHWTTGVNPVPARLVKFPHQQRELPEPICVPWWVGTGAVDLPFDFSGHMHRLCADVARCCPELAHVDANQILIGLTQARAGSLHGLQARLTPLRTRDGQLLRSHRGVTFQIQRYIVDGREMLYLLTFCVPRFFEQVFEEKLITLFHELYHISPAFNGDLRRHGGRCHVHSRSKNQYDRQMARLVDRYLATGPDPDLTDFLRLTFVQFLQRHGSVRGLVVPRPKLLPLGKTNAARNIL
jgi:hypothetical protein